MKLLHVVVDPLRHSPHDDPAHSGSLPSSSSSSSSFWWPDLVGGKPFEARRTRRARSVSWLFRYDDLVLHGHRGVKSATDSFLLLVDFFLCHGVRQGGPDCKFQEMIHIDPAASNRCFSVGRDAGWHCCVSPTPQFPLVLLKRSRCSRTIHGGSMWVRVDVESPCPGSATPRGCCRKAVGDAGRRARCSGCEG